MRAADKRQEALKKELEVRLQGRRAAFEAAREAIIERRKADADKKERQVTELSSGAALPADRGTPDPNEHNLDCAFHPRQVKEYLKRERELAGPCPACPVSEREGQSERWLLVLPLLCTSHCGRCLTFRFVIHCSLGP